MQPNRCADIGAWKKRWDAVHRQEVEELRRASPALRYRQLVSLMRMSQHLGWFEKMATDEDAAAEAEVRARWLMLKSSYRAQEKA